MKKTYKEVIVELEGTTTEIVRKKIRFEEDIDIETPEARLIISPLTSLLSKDSKIPFVMSSTWQKSRNCSPSDVGKFLPKRHPLIICGINRLLSCPFP